MPKMASGGPCSTFSHNEDEVVVVVVVVAASDVGADAGEASSSVPAEKIRVVLEFCRPGGDDEKESAAPAERDVHSSSTKVDVKSFMVRRGRPRFLHLWLLGRKKKMRREAPW
jgi:hypothetical protein